MRSRGGPAPSFSARSCTGRPDRTAWHLVLRSHLSETGSTRPRQNRPPGPPPPPPAPLFRPGGLEKYSTKNTLFTFPPSTHPAPPHAYAWSFAKAFDVQTPNGSSGNGRRAPGRSSPTPARTRILAKFCPLFKEWDGLGTPPLPKRPPAGPHSHLFTQTTLLNLYSKDKGRPARAGPGGGPSARAGGAAPPADSRGGAPPAATGRRPRLQTGGGVLDGRRAAHRSAPAESLSEAEAATGSASGEGPGEGGTRSGPIT